jgi:hypothetical protein
MSWTEVAAPDRVAVSLRLGAEGVSKHLPSAGTYDLK